MTRELLGSRWARRLAASLVCGVAVALLFAAGRDHWGNVFSTVLAGGGIRGGQVLGRGWIERRALDGLLEARDRPGGDTVLWRAFILEEWLQALWPGRR